MPHAGPDPFLDEHVALARRTLAAHGEFAPMVVAERGDGTRVPVVATFRNDTEEAVALTTARLILAATDAWRYALVQEIRFRFAAGDGPDEGVPVEAVLVAAVSRDATRVELFRPVRDESGRRTGIEPLTLDHPFRLPQAWLNLLGADRPLPGERAEARRLLAERGIRLPDELAP